MSEFPEIPSAALQQPAYLTDRRMVDVRYAGYAGTAYVPKSILEHKRRKADIIRRIKLSAGLLPEFPLPCNPPRITHRRIYQGVAICDVEVETLPGLKLTGNLYLPEKVTKKLPGILCPHGHWQNGRVEQSFRGNVVMRSFQFARLGFIVFAYDMLGYNDNNDLPHRFPPALRRQGDYCGITPFGLQTVNSLRALDLLASLPEVDAEKIGCTGASGGGSQTWFLGILDERVKVLAPVCMLSSHFQGGCTCEEGPLLRTTGVTSFDIVASLAPRPLLLPSVNGDWTIHVPDYEYPKMKKVYALFDAADKVENFHYPDEHNYNQRTCQHVYSFFLRYLAGKEAPMIVEEEKIAPPPPELLWHWGRKPAPATPETTRNAFGKLKRFFDSHSKPAVKEGKKILSELVSDNFPTENVVERVGWAPLPVSGGMVFQRMISRRDAGDHINAVRMIPGHTEEMRGSGNTAGKTGYLLLVSDALCTLHADPVCAPLCAALTAEKIPGMAMELLGRGESRLDLKRTLRDFDSPLDLAFNFPLYAMRVQDVCTVHCLLRERGFEKVVILSTPETTPIALSALALIPEADAVCDLKNVDDRVWRKKEFTQPLMGRIGGVRGLVRLASRPGVTFVNAEKYAKEIEENHGMLRTGDFSDAVKACLLLK